MLSRGCHPYLPNLKLALVFTLVLIAGTLSMPTGAGSQTSAFALEEATIEQLQEWMQARRYTSRQIVDLYLERIEQIDRGGPALRSVIEVNPDARAIADALDAERSARGP